ncbi:hypothetical protein Tsubulata_042095 [Turnera subulata]|uniref:RING-type E3 ubiquitin transferase n=1 Tax=Turnera subulata TaxID=218843 RepID=A0A9Q0JIU9_9ROSI|nr:hypothetical protein Tsubulata_042095 [Turnera subulata]
MFSDFFSLFLLNYGCSCLRCGHLFGLSCISKWIVQRGRSAKCPQCNSKCTLKDVRKLFAPRIAVVDEESQKRIRFLEAKCDSLEKKDAAWHKQESEAKKREAALQLEFDKLEKTELPVDGARLFDIDASASMLLLARKLPGMGGSHVLTKMSLISPHESEDIFLPSSTKFIKDMQISPLHEDLVLYACLGKKLSVLSMESNNMVLSYDLPAPAWTCSWDLSSSHYLCAGLQNGSLLLFDMRQTIRPVECRDIVASYRPKVEMPCEMVASQCPLTPLASGHGTSGFHLHLKRLGSNYHTLGTEFSTVSDIRLPKSAIINREDEKSLFALGEVTHQLVLQELPSFAVAQRFKPHNHYVCDVKYTNADGQDLLGCLSEDTVQLFSTKLS